MKIGNTKITGTAEQLTLFHKKLKKLPTNPRRMRETLTDFGEAHLNAEPGEVSAGRRPGAWAIRTYYRNSVNELCFCEESYSHHAATNAAFNRAVALAGKVRVEQLYGVRIEGTSGASLLGERARLVEFPSQRSCTGA